MRLVLFRLALVRLAPDKLAPRSCARWKLASVRLAPARLAPLRSRRLSLAPERSQPGQSFVRPARNAATSCALAGVLSAMSRSDPKTTRAGRERYTQRRLSGADHVTAPRPRPLPARP